MGLGVLEDTRLEHVPGTATLDYAARERRDHQHHQDIDIDPRLKYDRSGPHPIVLVPQPSDDPNDPLNWPLWRRDLILFILSILGVIASTLSPLLAANTVTLSLYFHRGFTDMALLTGYHLLGVAVAGILFVPSSRIWGKRHAFLIGNVVVILSSLWGGLSGHNYASLLWARIFQGVGLAPFEALVNAVVGDLYCVHQRGKRMAWSNLALFGGSFFTPVIVGKMTATMGWQWPFYFVAIFAAVMLPILIFFVPETAYRRDAWLNTDTATSEHLHAAGAGQQLQPYDTHTGQSIESYAGDKEGSRASASHAGSVDKPDGDTETHNLNPPPRVPVPPKKSYSRQLLPFDGRKTDEGFWKLFLRPFPLFLHPGILWCCLIQGTLIGWTVMIGIVLAAILLGPPLYFTEVQTGYMYTGAFVGAVLGFVVAGLLADSVPALLTRRNNGVYEPEFRMVLVVPQLVFGCAGLYGFGITSADTARYHWIWPDFFFALEVMGMVLGAVASALYIVDAHREIAVEAFTCLLVFKNMFSFGLTWSSYDWLVHDGVENVFTSVASVQVGICCLTVLMYVFGKRNRSFFARHDIFELTGLW
ncbi:MFS transporter [Saccharata proteae CBS 121410]|uniref:MFS transporter n=1 Tax=Saccharata proteae CBS 121410 TaxID=1314787 RepID=A0A9P4HM74_9PEZI|nr:MFS transporter [Saccharata proteae CBS 121410]